MLTLLEEVKLRIQIEICSEYKSIMESLQHITLSRFDHNPPLLFHYQRTKHSFKNRKKIFEKFFEQKTHRKILIRH